MSAILNDVGTYLDSQFVELVQGKTLFRDRFPAKLQFACAIMEEGSKISGDGHREFYKATDGQVYQTRESTLLVHVRMLGKLESESLCGRITAALTNLDTNVFSTFRLNAIRYVSGPTFFPEVVMVDGVRTYPFLSTFTIFYEDLVTTSIA